MASLVSSSEDALVQRGESSGPRNSNNELSYGPDQGRFIQERKNILTHTRSTPVGADLSHLHAPFSLLLPGAGFDPGRLLGNTR